MDKDESSSRNGDQPNTEAFTRFKRLAKGLLAVPKKELDRKLASEKRKKAKRRKTA